MSTTKTSSRPSPFAMFRSTARPKPAAKADDTDQDDGNDQVLDDEEDLEDDDETRARKKAKRAKKAKADDEQDQADDADPKARAARQRERERVAAILSADVVVNGGAPIRAAALHAATLTSMPRGEAIGTLHLLAGTASQSSPSAHQDARPMRVTAEQIVAAGEMARGERSIPYRAPDQKMHRATAAQVIAAAAKARSR